MVDPELAARVAAVLDNRLTVAGFSVPWPITKVLVRETLDQTLLNGELNPAAPDPGKLKTYQYLSTTGGFTGAKLVEQLGGGYLYYQDYQNEPNPISAHVVEKAVSVDPGWQLENAPVAKPKVEKPTPKNPTTYVSKNGSKLVDQGDGYYVEYDAEHHGVTTHPKDMIDVAMKDNPHWTLLAEAADEKFTVTDAFVAKLDAEEKKQALEEKHYAAMTQAALELKLAKTGGENPAVAVTSAIPEHLIKFDALGSSLDDYIFSCTACDWKMTCGLPVSIVGKGAVPIATFGKVAHDKWFDAKEQEYANGNATSGKTYYHPKGVAKLVEQPDGNYQWYWQIGDKKGQKGPLYKWDQVKWIADDWSDVPSSCIMATEFQGVTVECGKALNHHDNHEASYNEGSLFWINPAHPHWEPQPDDGPITAYTREVDGHNEWLIKMASFEWNQYDHNGQVVNTFSDEFVQGAMDDGGMMVEEGWEAQNDGAAWAGVQAANKKAQD